jgi:hypothetical protein
MSYSEHRNFFALFINKMYSISPSYIYFPRTLEALQQQVQDYAGQHLPGACGSIDVVHVKWSRCPAGDYNKCKGKESFASVAFECVTNNRQRFLASLLFNLAQEATSTLYGLIRRLIPSAMIGTKNIKRRDQA